MTLRLVRSFSLSTAILVSAWPVSAEPALALRLEVHGAAGERLGVLVKALDENGEVVRTIAASAPGRVAIEPAPAPGTLLIAEVAGFWSTRAEAPAPGTDAGEPVISLWPEATLAARLSVPGGTPLPESVAVRIGSAVAEGGRARPPELEPITIDCPVGAEGRLRCGVPALAAADLRFRVPGFASRFVWGLELRAGEIRDVGSLRLEPGASVVGRVEAPSPIDLRDVVLAIEPAPGSPYEVAREGGVVRQEVRADRRGFFAFESLGAGVYRLLVEHPEIERVEVGPVRVVEGSQTELAEPVVLRRAERLRLSIQPPFDPFGEDWAVRFHHIDAPGRKNPRAAAEATATAGYVPGVGLAPGSYEVTVFDSRRTPLAQPRIEHEPGDELHTIVVEAVRLEGRVGLGEEPLVARLSFQGPTGAIEMESDADGRFGGVLPRAGRWDVAVEAPMPPVEWRRMVEVEADAGAVLLELVLPDTHVAGIVVDEDGKPRPDASVTLHQPLQSESVASTRETDVDGQFSFHGLGEGTYQAEAQDGAGLASLPVSVEIAEDEPTAELRLVLRRRPSLRARLVTPAGDALPGVWFTPLAYSADGRLLIDPNASQASTDAAGRLEVSLPPKTETVRLTALAPGFALRSWSLRPGDAGDLLVAPSGGTLVVELPAPISAIDWKGPLRPMLFDGEGFPLAIPQLAQWAQGNGVEVSTSSNRLTVPALGAGIFRLCWTSGEDLARIGTPIAGCDAGQLAAGGGLTLRLAAPSGD